MKIIKTMIQYIKHPSLFLFRLDVHGIIKLNDEFYVKEHYLKTFNKKLNLKNPKTFNEKLQWLKLNDRKNIYSVMVDKYEVKKLVSSSIGVEHIIPTLGIYEKFDDIDFNKLPNQFVIKCTHNSGGIVICKDKSKFNIRNAKKIINKALKKKFFYYGREWPYKNVKPRIIIENYLEDDNKELIDYKFWCFNGKPEICLVCSDRQVDLKETFYDMDWNLLDIKRPGHDIDLTINKPNSFKLMKKISKELAKDIPFIRVDFYEVNGKVLVGELTFYPASGFAKFEPDEWDFKLGKLLELPKVKEEGKNEK